MTGELFSYVFFFVISAAVAVSGSIRVRETEPETEDRCSAVESQIFGSMLALIALGMIYGYIYNGPAQSISSCGFIC